jgi:hypothetical protein
MTHTQPDEFRRERLVKGGMAYGYKVSSLLT